MFGSWSKSICLKRDSCLSFIYECMKPTATASYLFSSSDRSLIRFLASVWLKGKSTEPSAETRSESTYLSFRSISGLGNSRLRSYCSNLLSVLISIVSRKPFVVTKAVSAPVLEIKAFVAKVVPCMKESSSDRSDPESSITACMPWRIPISGDS